MIQPVDKELNGSIETEKAAEESDRISEFKKRAERDFFATISGYIDKSFFKDEKGRYFKQRHDRYNLYATQALLSDLKRLCLNYQKVTGIWEGEFERSYVVWNTAYSYEQFQKIILELSKFYKQWAVCIGRKVGDDLYDIDLWSTDSLEDIEYYKYSHYTKVSIVEALRLNGTVLTRKIYNSDGEVDPDKIKRKIQFEQMKENLGLSSNESLHGAYGREANVKRLLSGEFNKDGRASFEQIKETVFRR